MQPPAECSLFPEWKETVERLAASARRVMLVGPTDAGKTTFCTLLANAAIAQKRTVAWIDADVGQSEVGPPACVGLAYAREPFSGPSGLPVERIAFVGSVNPRGCMLEHVVAVAELAEAALEADLILLDTTGYLAGAGARRLKQAKASLFRPDHVVGLQREFEAEHVLLGLERAGKTSVIRAVVPAAVTRKPPALRAQRRAARFARCFEGAEPRVFDLDRIGLLNTWLNTGTPLQPHLLKFLSTALRTRVFHAEMQGRQLNIVAAVSVPPERLSLVHEQFRPQGIAITAAPSLKNLVVGLSDDNRLLGLGIIETVDFRRRQLVVRTATPAWRSVRILQLGLLRIRADGTELGVNRPGEV